MTSPRPDEPDEGADGRAEKLTNPAMTSGKSLLMLRQYVETTQGADAFARVLEAMPPHERANVPNLVLPNSWYPTTSVSAALETAQRVFGPSDFYERYGEWAAGYVLNVVYRFVLKLKTTRWMLERAGSMWPQFQSTGRWEIETADGRFQAILHDFGVPGPFCRVMVGWIGRAGVLHE